MSLFYTSFGTVDMMSTYHANITSAHGSHPFGYCAKITPAGGLTSAVRIYSGQLLGHADGVSATNFARMEQVGVAGTLVVVVMPATNTVSGKVSLTGTDTLGKVVANLGTYAIIGGRFDRRLPR